ncbi:MAG TPA: family 1 glycosylhydrolase [Polyangia bacterium]
MRRDDRSAGAVALATGIFFAAAVAAAGCHHELSFAPTDIAAHPLLAGAPRGFFLGAATSAHQIEGGTLNDWTAWERGRYPDGRPHVADGGTTARAADSWHRWPDDVAALRTLGANVYRLGVEWSRLEPTAGAWDQAAAENYRAMFAALRAARIEPLVTLHHFTLPPWIAARGGWEWEGAPAAFAAFAGRAGAAFGDLVDWWCTINEPNVFVAKGYLSAEWPPGVADPKRGAAVMRALIIGHVQATAELRRADRVDADGDGRPTVIGVAQNLRVFDAASRNPVDALVASAAARFYNDSFIDAVATGRIHISIPTVVTIDEAYPAARGTFDYLGVNYYTRERVIGHLFGGAKNTYQRAPPDGRRPVSDMGWEIYPEGLTRLLLHYAAYEWPLLVTENGVADARGDRRPDFLRAHIYALDQARAGGADVIGYIVWSLIDNFEWSRGYQGRFGLFSIDFAGDPTLQRRPTPAVATFQEAARALGGRP